MTRLLDALPRATDKCAVLVADPDGDARLILSSLLGHAGYRVLEAQDGESAWAVAHRERPSLVITELYLPVRESPCLVRPLAESDALVGLRVLVHSAYTFERDRQWAEASGGDCFLPKPARLPVVLVAVRSLLFS